jgi:hypothetical protein
MTAKKLAELEEHFLTEWQRATADFSYHDALATLYAESSTVLAPIFVTAPGKKK